MDKNQDSNQKDEKPSKKDKKAHEKLTDCLKKHTKHANGFVEFIKNQNVIGLAVGLVLGTAASLLVNSLINNVVMPPLGFLLGSSEGLRGLSWNMGVASDGNDVILNYGIFLADLINFLVLALVVYVVVKLLKLEMKKR